MWQSITEMYSSGSRFEIISLNFSLYALYPSLSALENPNQPIVHGSIHSP